MGALGNCFSGNLWQRCTDMQTLRVGSLLSGQLGEEEVIALMVLINCWLNRAMGASTLGVTHVMQDCRNHFASDQSSCCSVFI